jgi:hypothetical protein
VRERAAPRAPQAVSPTHGPRVVLGSEVRALLSQKFGATAASAGRADAADTAGKDVGSRWANVRRIADERGPRIGRADPDARDRWDALQPRLTELERMLARTGEHARDLARRKLATAAATLPRLRDDIVYAAG